MTVTPEWITMASALGFGGGRPIVWLGRDEGALSEVPGNARYVVATELEGRVSSATLESILTNRQKLAAGLLVRVGGLTTVRALLRRGDKLAEVTAYGVFVDYYTSHIPFDKVGEAATLRYCLGLRRNPGSRATVIHLIKVLLTFIGLGRLLFDYYLVYLEKHDDDR